MRRVAPRRLAPLALVAALSCGAVACHDDTPATVTDPSKGVPFTTPSRAEIAKRAGFAFPASTTGFESVRMGDELHVVLHIAAADVDAFAAGSKLTLTPGKRVILHASPVWDLNPSGTIAGSDSSSSSIERKVEVVSGADPVLVRIVLSNVAAG